MNAVFSIKPIASLQYVAQKIHDIIKVTITKSNRTKQTRVTEKFEMLSMPLTKNVLCCNVQLNCACVEAAAFAKKTTA